MKLPINYDSATWQERKAARLQYAELQNNLCAHCNTLLTEAPHESVTSKKINTALFPPTMFNYPVHLHHDHKSGMTIGAVHSVCNAVLWQYHGE
jgi:hypothetical protein